MLLLFVCLFLHTFLVLLYVAILFHQISTDFSPICCSFCLCVREVSLLKRGSSVELVWCSFGYTWSSQRGERAHHGVSIAWQSIQLLVHYEPSLLSRNALHTSAKCSAKQAITFCPISITLRHFFTSLYFTLTSFFLPLLPKKRKKNVFEPLWSSNFVIFFLFCFCDSLHHVLHKLSSPHRYFALSILGILGSGKTFW